MNYVLCLGKSLLYWTNTWLLNKVNYLPAFKRETVSFPAEEFLFTYPIRKPSPAIMIAITKRNSKICQTRKVRLRWKQQEKLYLFLKQFSCFFTSYPSHTVRVDALSNVRTLSISCSLRQQGNKLYWRSVAKLASEICLRQDNPRDLFWRPKPRLKTFKYCARWLVPRRLWVSIRRERVTAGDESGSESRFGWWERNPALPT